ncbi:multicopper oxidase family protein [Halomonas sp. A29]|uniref:multicopper oxidase family protein n=1 Tax=Halomonas sp. A29 TaxID=3102786 RepID=UPI00398AA3CB
MQRRDFLRYSALGGVALSTSGLLAYAMAGRPHSHNPLAPFDLSSLPHGEPLRALPRIVNLAERERTFRAALAAGPVEVPLGDTRVAWLWLYNGKVAPLIEVREGDELDATLINELTQETTIHWHGVAVKNEYDGGPADAVPPGESRRYRHRFAEGSAGLHWFHPHPHGVLAEQIAHGLAGVLLVRPHEDPLPPDVEEHLLVVSDLRLSADGKVAAHTDEDWMNGREGELLLVNGQRQPQLEVAPGATLRLRLVNGCAGRYLRLRLEEHELTLIGSDGGLIEKPQALPELLLTPGERADLLVRVATRGGERFDLSSHPYDRGWMGVRPAHLDEPARLLTVRTSNEDVLPAVSLPERLRRIERLGEPAIHRQVVLTEVMQGAGHEGHGDHASDQEPRQEHADHAGDQAEHGDHGGHAHAGRETHAASEQQSERPAIDFLLNGRSFSMGEVMFEGRVGEVEEWEIFNDSHMDHPFHVHGTHFQVVAERKADGDWHETPWLAWKDTVNLAPYERARIRLAFQAPGDWLFHCHIIEHEEMGMMAAIRVR